ncbi:MAG: Lrp/AsnC ligand binding domain-containing protein [Actinomycetota bacterium]|nr:Lrp/AsnC ligand binding domain-containing protein [Actinomycetota bacterium]
MVEAYVLMKSEPGQQGDIYTKVSKLKGVKSVKTVSGPYDLIILIESESLNDLGKMVISKIQNLRGIKDTTSCIVIEPI